MKTRVSNTAISTLAVIAFAFSRLNSLGVDEYQDLADVVAAIQSMASGSGGDATAFKLTDNGGAEIQTQGVTLPGTPIWCLGIAKSGSGARKILVTGTHHAREWVAYRAVFDAAQFILKGVGSHY